MLLRAARHMIILPHCDWSPENELLGLAMNKLPKRHIAFKSRSVEQRSDGIVAHLQFLGSFIGVIIVNP